MRAAFEWRVEDCQDCDGGWVEENCGISNFERFAGTRSVRCRECDGSGDVPKDCEGCGDVAPLSEAGLCRQCTLDNLPEEIMRMASVYHAGARCPGCGGSNWIIGRATAECGGCGFALDMPHAATGGGTFTTTKPVAGWKGVYRA